MTFLTWMAGPSGQLLASACAIAVLALILLVSAKLYRSYRRSRAHLLLVIALPIAILQQAALVSLSFQQLSYSPYLHMIDSIAGPLSFIVFNFAFMTLYTGPSSRLRSAPFILMAAGLLIATAAQLLLDPDALRPAGESVPAMLAVDFYGLAINFAILLNLRAVQPRAGYTASLFVYFVYQLSSLADSYMFHGAVPLLAAMRHWLPVVYDALLFGLLFDWLLERLLTTYQSAITDGLTGLYNRRHFNKKAGQLLRQSGRIAIVYCVVDSFQRLNDLEGQNKANAALRQIADIIGEESADAGFGGRLDGEELICAVALSGIKPERLAERIRSRSEQEVAATISVGVSCSRENIELAELVKQAEEAMRQSQLSGGNKVTLHPSAKRSRTRPAEDESQRDDAPA